MKSVDLTNVQESGDGLRLPAGGYICKYTNVEDRPDKEYLYMEYDIVEGEFKDYYKDLSARADFWGGRVYRSYKPAALPMFKRMCTAVSKSNGNFVFDGGAINNNEKTLIGKYVGLVFGEEEYIGNDGNKKTRLYVFAEKSVQDIRDGNYKVPKLKLLKEDTPANTSAPASGLEGFMNIPDDAGDEFPFN